MRSALSPQLASGGARTLLIVPMIKENELVGTIGIYRQEYGRSPTSRSSCLRILPSRPSSPSRIRGCSTSCANLAQQTATSEVLQRHQQLAGVLQWYSSHAGECDSHLCVATFGVSCCG